MHSKSYTDKSNSASPTLGDLGSCYYLPNPTNVELDFDRTSFVSDIGRTNTPPPEDGGKDKNKYCVKCGDGPYSDWQVLCAKPDCQGKLEKKKK